MRRRRSECPAQFQYFHLIDCKAEKNDLTRWGERAILTKKLKIIAMMSPKIRRVSCRTLKWMFSFRNVAWNLHNEFNSTFSFLPTDSRWHRALSYGTKCNHLCDECDQRNVTLTETISRKKINNFSIAIESEIKETKKKLRKKDENRQRYQSAFRLLQWRRWY